MSHSVQQEAIAHTSSPLCVIGGPGTGKTTLLIQKIISLISKGYSPEDLLAITSTQKTAQKISKNVEEELGESFTTRTYDSFFLEIFKYHYSKNPKILDEMGQIYFFISKLKTTTLSSNYGKTPQKDIAKGFQEAISLLKEHKITPEKLSSLYFENPDYKADLLTLFAHYEIYKKENNFLDFADIQLEVKEILELNGEEIKKQYSYVLIDEFQDTNILQAEIITKLSDTHVTVVGDPKQSIYSCRETTQDSLEEFFKKKNPKKLYLKENFRSSQNLVTCFNNYISEFRNTKELLQSNTSSYGYATHICASNTISQKNYIVENIKNNPNSSIGILCRSKSQVNEFSNLLNRCTIKHNAPEVEDFFAQPLVKEFILLIKILGKPREENISFYKILESLNLKEETLLNISRKTSHYEKSFYELLKRKNPICENPQDNEIITQFFRRFKKLVLLKESKLPIRELILEITKEFDFYKKALIQGEKAILNLNHFIDFCSNSCEKYQFPTLKEFIEYLEFSSTISCNSLASMNSKNNANIAVITISHSRGDEFDHVLIPGCNDKNIPKKFGNKKFPTPFDLKQQEHNDEEQKLFFVAITRAKRELHLLHVQYDNENKIPLKESSFITSLEIETQNYDNQIQNIPSYSQAHQIERELTQQVIHHLHNKNFAYARDRLELYENLFSTNTSLKSFLGDTEEFKTLQKRMNETINPISYDFSKHTYSVSQLKTYQQCPKKYLYQYIYKIPTPSKPYFDFGTSIHSVLEHIKPEIDKGLDKQKTTLRALGMLSYYWISKSYQTSKEEEEYYNLAIECIKDYIEKEFTLKEEQRTTISLEKKFTLTIDGKKIIGYIDRIDQNQNGILIYDYKTSSSKLSQNDLKEDLQLYTYALAIEENQEFSKPLFKMAHWYLKHNTISSVEFDNIKAEEIKKTLKTLLSNIENKDFKATPSTFACNYCDFNSICPDSKALR